VKLEIAFFFGLLYRDAQDIRPDNLAFFISGIAAGYQITLPDIR
jgi:hypothetical protein